MRITNYNFKLWFLDSQKERMDYNSVREKSIEFLSATGNIIVGEAHHIFDGKPECNTGVFLLSTSHLCWHTFPEHGYISFSYSSCSKDVKTLGEIVEISSKIFGSDGFSM